MANTEVAEHGTETRTRPGLTKKTILWVDASSVSINENQAFLHRAGYSCLRVSSAEAGFDFLTKQRPDLIILEYELPEMNGRAFLGELVGNSKYKAVSDVPVVMLTQAALDSRVRRLLFDGGLSACLQKPFGSHELLNVLENVFFLHTIRLQSKKAKQEEKRTEYKYQDLIENASDLIFTLDLKANFALINRRLPIITGWEREDWLGKSFLKLIDPDDRESTLNNFNNTIHGKSSVFEARVTHRNGHHI